MSKYDGHTPEPWEFTTNRVTRHPRTVYADPDGDDIETTDICTLPEWIDAYKHEALANANLIADAPKLLRQRDRLFKALKAMDDIVQEGQGTWTIEAQREARAAIAEVEADA